MSGGVVCCGEVFNTNKTLREHELLFHTERFGPQPEITRYPHNMTREQCRLWIAVEAMKIPSPDGELVDYELFAKSRFRIADAMLKEGDKADD